MIKCEECSKKLHLIQGYRHPALGTKFLVCRKCFDKITENMEKWSKFCLNSDHELTRIETQDAWHENISNDSELQKWFRNLWIKIIE